MGCKTCIDPNTACLQKKPIKKIMIVIVHCLQLACKDSGFCILEIKEIYVCISLINSS